MAEFSDAFVMLPGFGTSEEFMEAVTWRQLAIHEKPSGVLNVDKCFADLLAFVAHPVEMGFIRPHNAAQIAVSDPGHSIGQIGRRLQSWVVAVGCPALDHICEVHTFWVGRRHALRAARIGTDPGATNRQRECPSPAPYASHDPMQQFTTSGCGRSGGATTTGGRSEGRRKKSESMSGPHTFSFVDSQKPLRRG